ncbi:MAG TPA: G1 family glutamic endopeptidase [Solirubrobacteraceae bacterium]|nr:G1 family glutamic endopeptidase [Solirubrobacteraceae bacterium]
MASDSVIVPRLTRLRRCALAWAITLALLALAAAPAGASTLSSNWAGWVALGSSSSHASFSSVSGTWQVPKVSCASGQSTYSAAWVGLGGYAQDSNALEQVGVDADCSRSGQPHYDSWYELIPAAPVSIDIPVHAGDEMTGSVTVHGNHVTLRLRNLTTGARYSTTRHASQIDVSSADWILEAPSSCTPAGCQTLPLADFGNVSFSAATATSGAHTGPVQDPRWSAEQIELRQGARPGTARFANGHVLPANEVIAASSAAGGPLGAFSVQWSEHQPLGEGHRPRSFGEAVPFGEGSNAGS